MSCFWDTLLQSKLFKIKSSIEIISFLKKNNRRTNCLVNGKQLSTKQIEENFQAIACLDEKKHNHGYMTSMCEPVLCLMCDFFDVHIVHEWRLQRNKYIISYSSLKNIKNKKQIIVIYSNNNHAWFGKII
jgi:hypothetical protein